MKIDPYNTEKHYLDWKQEIKQTGIKELSKCNSDLLLNYLGDMEIGVNVGLGSKKGSRSYIRLRALRDKMTFIMKKINEVYNLNSITEINEDQIHSLFSAMRKGEIRKQNGQNYKAVSDYVKIFNAFWNWWIKINKKKGIEIKNLTSYLDTSDEKPDWVYLTEDQIKKLCDNAKYEYRILIMFLYDTGIRAPTELMNVKVSDFFNDFKELNIREEVSKTFGRRIKLLLSSKLIKEYVQNKNLGKEDFIFPISPPIANKYLQRLAKKLFGDAVSEAGQKYSQLTMYDFRHCSCCYWLPRYKSESALKYRFGWKKSDKIHYYSEMLGMKDTISEEDLLVDVTKTEMEKRLLQTEKENALLNEKLKVMEKQMEEIYGLTKRLYEKKS
jgi:integrase